ncbi:hypothetical protein HDU93_005935 [Gonapodya sp. JEL0774]|nr:hypothetical protein HDU93_005935 [Gonapodya sp. JEL0774]
MSGGDLGDTDMGSDIYDPAEEDVFEMDFELNKRDKPPTDTVHEASTQTEESLSTSDIITLVFDLMVLTRTMDISMNQFSTLLGYIKGILSLDLSIGNMSKENRAKMDHIFVAAFIPTDKMVFKKNERPPFWMHPFLEPLIEEIQVGFIKDILSFALHVTTQLTVKWLVSSIRESVLAVDANISGQYLDIEEMMKGTYFMMQVEFLYKDQNITTQV